MKISKKLLALALSCMMLAGCGNTAGDTGTAPQASAAGTASTAPEGPKTGDGS